MWFKSLPVHGGITGFPLLKAMFALIVDTFELKANMNPNDSTLNNFFFQYRANG
ncbi:protein of unknown function [Methylotuvimicrobium alcaliphilum 20Z]|uniref:Uncharacterized protein n=1 Tax=Methylotuvimicrobium alcaliphilum (strain DSM 19304 / NCIMB 14124 / VKM B-2133 / 20Z) TaxID=1091494 RepID=G4T0U5_META2|nr:protein of unknown function [Methylotuvimicrobium alcaliphilum 20Z]